MDDERFKETGNRYSKVPRVALVNSINQYKVFKGRLDAAEKQISALLDSVYKDARQNIMSSTAATQMEFKSMKEYQSGVKKLLVQKTIANDHVEKVKKQKTKLDEFKKVDIDEDTFN